MRPGRGMRLVTAATGLILLTACTRPPEPPLADRHQPDQTEAPIVVSARAFTPGFLPHDVTDPYAQRIATLLFRGLVRYDAKGKAINEIAESIDSDDHRTFRIRIKDGWTFSNGEPITAASFIDSWNSAVTATGTHSNVSVFTPILGFAQARQAKRGKPATRTMRGLKLLDRLSFTVTLAAPRPGFVNRLGHVAFAPLPEAARRNPAAFAKEPVGNGPYRLDSSATSAQQVVLRPNSTYRGSDLPQNMGLVFRLYSDPAKAYADLTAGRLDVLDQLPLTALPTMRADLKIRGINQPVGLTQNLVFPMDRASWRSVGGRRLRQGISRAVDRETLSRTLFTDTRRPATDFGAPVVEGYLPDLCATACRFDPTTAATTVRDADADGETLRVAYAADTDDIVWLRSVCATITDVTGVGCTPVPYRTQAALTQAVLDRKVPGPFVATTRMDVADLSGFLDPRFVAGATSNDSGYSDRRVQSLLTAAAALPSGGQQVAIYQEAERKLIADLPVIPLWVLNATGGWSPAVTAVKMDVFGVPVYTEIARP